MTNEPTRGWWAISGDDLYAALQRVAEGEHPDQVYADLEAESLITRPSDDDDR